VNVVLGNKNIEINAQEFKDLAKCYDEVVIDIGTGDGRFIYKNALKFKDSFFVGIDPSDSQLREYSKKALRKKLPNIMFVVGSLEQLPNELENSAQKMFINLPWGSLLEATVKPENKLINNISKLLKNGGLLQIMVGYHEDQEPSETVRLNLPDLDQTYIDNNLTKEYKKLGFSIQKIEKFNKTDLKKIETTWAKKLSFGKDRNIFKLTFKKNL